MVSQSHAGHHLWIGPCGDAVVKRIGAFILALVLVPLTASAGTTGSIAGTVLGTGTGSPIANAKVTAISGAEIQVARTDARGDFAFVSLTPGTYIVEIERDGYATAIRVGVHVAADSTARLALDRRDRHH